MRNRSSLALCVGLLSLLLPHLLLPHLAAASPSNKSSQPQLLLLNQSKLDFIKQHLHLPQNAIQLAYLKGKADAFASAPPLSVTQNIPIGASGDHRDYFTVGPYWWPDTSKKDGLPWIRKDGQVNHSVRGPNSDSKLLDALVRRLNFLALSYRFTQNERYVKAAEVLLNTWFLDDKTGMNPHLNFAQAIPGRVNGRGIGIIEVRRLIGALDAITLLQNELPAETVDALNTWLSTFLSWLIESKNGQDEAKKENNHGTFYDFILASLALHLKMDDLAEQVFASASKRALKQIQQDGSQAHELHRTKPFHYSVFNLYAFAGIAKLARQSNSQFFKRDSIEAQYLIQANNYLYENLTTSKIWPGTQEKTLNVSKLIDASIVLRVAYPDLPSNEVYFKEFPEAQARLKYCQPWMIAADNKVDDNTAEDSSHSQAKDTQPDSTYFCDFLH